MKEQYWRPIKEQRLMKLVKELLLKPCIENNLQKKLKLSRKDYILRLKQLKKLKRKLMKEKKKLEKREKRL